MAGLIGSLLGSQPVAGFQRRCGLFPRGEEPRAQAVGNGNRPLTPRDVRNGQRPGVSLPTDCATCNGSPGDGWKVTRATGAGCERSRSSVCSPEPRPLPPAVLYTVTPSPGGAWGNARFLNQECSQDYVVKNYFYYYLFRISAAMGQEVFYITFLPFTYWIINAYVARRLIIMWSVTMYIGQVMKDLLKWPRPHSPPVVKLEKKTNAEYGMPSTHAMAATVISFTFVSVTANQYKYPLELGLLGAFLFSSLVGLSRIYTGMHTVLDVIVGSLISLFLTAIACPTWDIVDHLMLTSPFCPAFCIIVPLFLCYNYPRLDYYSPTRADTTTILGASAGAIIGFWANNRYVSNAASKDVPHSVSSITIEIILLVLAKFIVGIGVLMITRQIAKTVVRKSLCSWHKVSNSDAVGMQQIKIEVPYKFITYSSIGLSATMFVPLVYTFFGLN